MLVHKIIYILLLTILGLLVFYRNQPNKIEYFKNSADKFIKRNLIEKYSNNLTESIKCNQNHKVKPLSIIKYIDENYELFQKNGAEKDFGIETSTKFTKRYVNFERVAFFAHFNILRNNNELKDAIISKINSDKDMSEKINDQLNNVIEKDGQLIYGFDFKNNYERVYLNYKEGKEKYFIDGYEWNLNYKNYKNYKSIDNTTNIIKELAELFNNKITDMLLQIFPEDNWDILLEKTDTVLSKSYYFSFKIDPMLKNVYPKLKELLYYINPNKYIINKWYECNRNNIISWITLSLDKNNEVELNIYFISSDKNLQLFTENMAKLIQSRKILDKIII